MVSEAFLLPIVRVPTAGPFRFSTWQRCGRPVLVLRDPFGTKMPNTLSTAETDLSVKSVIPVNIDGTVISDEGEISYLLGALHQTKMFFERTGYMEAFTSFPPAPSPARAARQLSTPSRPSTSPLARL